MAKHTWAGILAEKYKAWLEKAVQDSGLEMIGRLGREYIEGTFADTAKKNHDVKLKKEIRWLNEVIEDGDGWAAFTITTVTGVGVKENRKHITAI